MSLPPSPPSLLYLRLDELQVQVSHFLFFTFSHNHVNVVQIVAVDMFLELQ